MKVMMKTLLGTTAAIALLAQSAFAITVTPSSDADYLGGIILGSGITINSASFIGASGSAGKFTGGTAAGIGIESGILITSGAAMNVNGTANTADDITTDNNAPGAAFLDALVPGYTTHDAAYLTLTFTTAGGDLFFNYVFGSDEYNEYVGSSFNDVFGFFLDGQAVANNIARLPDGTAVAINNVNLGQNAGLYNNNENGAYPFEYDGFTGVLTASALDLASGEHTIMLAIADSGDEILDSGVFIQAGTFSDEPNPPGVPDGGATILLLGAALSGLGMLRRKV